MNKKDKKFIAALMIAQTGILLVAISLSGKYWYASVTNLMGLNNLQEITGWLKGENRKIESEETVAKLKQHYEKQGIEAEED